MTLNLAQTSVVKSRPSVPHVANLLWTLLPQKPKIGRIDQRAGHAHRDVNITVKMRRRKRHARDAPFVKSHGVWTQDRHVWIYVSPWRRTYLLSFVFVTFLSANIDIVDWHLVSHLTISCSRPTRYSGRDIWRLGLLTAYRNIGRVPN